MLGYGKKLRWFKIVLVAALLTSLMIPVATWPYIKESLASGLSDFLIFYTGARVLRSGMGEQLYDYETQKAYQEQLGLALPGRKGALLFNHLPYELLLFRPLERLPYIQAHALWSIINIGLLGLIFKQIRPLIHVPNRPIAALCIFGSYPVMIALIQGQDSIVVTLLLTLTVTHLKGGRDGWAGILLSLGLFKPQLVLPFAGALLFQRRWRAVGGFLAGGVSVALISLGLVGWGGLKAWFSLIRAMDQQQYTIYPGLMPNVRGFLESTLTGAAGPWRYSARIAASAALLMWLWAGWHSEQGAKETTFNLKVSLTILITVLLSYHLYTHDLSILVLPSVLTVNYMFSESAQSPTALAVLGASVLILNFNGTYGQWLLIGRLYWLAAVLLGWAAALTYEIAGRRNGAPHPLLKTE